MIFVSQLEGVPENKTLYYVYAWDAPKELGGQEVLIGDI